MAADALEARLNVGHAADSAVVAVAGAEDFAATEHLLSLLSVLPAPQDDQEFWHDLQKASGGAYLHPHQHEADGAARHRRQSPAAWPGRSWAGTEAMTATHRQAVAELVGEAPASAAV